MSDDFVFDVKAKKVRKSDSQLLVSLHEYAQQKDMQYFTTTDYNKWNNKVVWAEVISERFGSWKKALSLIGVEGARERKYSDRFLMDNLEAVWRELGYPPGKRKLSNYGEHISERPYKDRWGSLKNACELLAKHKEGKIQWDDIINQSSINPAILPVRKAISSDLRFRVLKRDYFKCVKCGKSPAKSHDVELEVDHIKPHSRGGSDDLENLQTLCNRCNSGKSNRHTI